MMDRSHAASSSGGALTRKAKIESSGGGDRLSKLTDHALGHVLSFLPAEEAARAAMLSSRWRHVFAAVHTVSLVEPEGPIRSYDDDNVCHTPEFQPSADPNAPPSYNSIVSAAIMARQRRRGAVPLRALRVAVESYRSRDSLTVDQWVSYAVQQGAAAEEGLDLDLHLQCRSSTCEKSPDWWSRRSMEEYLATWVIFSCAHLRSLSLSCCQLSPPSTVTLPSLVTLLLSRVSDPGSEVERLVAGCPRLADLTLEACSAVTALSIVGGARLRRLALRCCHNLTAVAVDSSELQAFEYRGAMPDSSFLTMYGGSTRIAYCKFDICGGESMMNLWQLLQLFVNAKHLHLESSHLSSGINWGVPIGFPSFSSLLHLEMRGCLPDDDTGGAAIAAVSTVLELAPNLETLSLAFHAQEHDSGGRPDYMYLSEEVALEAHHLSYNPHSALATPPTSAAMIPCLRNKVREMNLVHYQGGTAQRVLAKFLLSNAPVIDRLWCEFAEGPMWTQTQLMREMKGWLINKSAETHFA